MKFNLYKDLLADRNIMSHVFLSSISRNEEYFEQFNLIPDEDKKNKTVEVDIEMKVNGIEVSPETFFQNMYDQYVSQVKSEARNLFQNKMAGQFQDKLDDLMNRLSDISEVVKSWEKEINWEVKNPFKD